MGKKTRKKVVKRRRMNEVLYGRQAWRCLQCYPDKMYVESSERMPIVATIYVGRRKIKIGNTKKKLLIAWCTECNRWLAREVKYGKTLEPTDIAHELSDGKQGKGTMDWETFCNMCDDWRKYLKGE